MKYYEQLFELLFVGGLLQPGGSYLDEKRSPIYILKDDPEYDGVKGIVEVLKRVIQRYKYLQKPLEENFLPDLLGYLPKWEPKDRTKLAEATALLIIDLQCGPKCLASLTKDHVVKDNVALNFLTDFIKIYLSKQSMDSLASTIRRSGLKDILGVFPQPVRDSKHLEAHFKKENLPGINEWYGKVMLSEIKEETIGSIHRMISEEETNENVCIYLD